MARQLSLFDEESDRSGAPPGAPGETTTANEPGPASLPSELVELAGRLPEGLHLGSSSWAFTGWRGLVYEADHDEKVLAKRGLPAYARHPILRTVGLDRTFYRPESVDGMKALARDLPPGFRLLVKAPSVVTRPALPPAARPRGRSGGWADNPLFMDPEYAAREAVEPLVAGLEEHAGPLVFQLSPLPRFRLRDPEAFVDGLHAMLRALPRGPLYAVELRNAELLRADYASALADAGAAHALNVHPTMPPPREQAQRLGAGAFGPGLVVRWMLGHDQAYEDAKSRYAPFDRIVDPDPDSREQIAELALEAAAAGKPAFVVINNKAEGSAPLSAIALARSVRNLADQRTR